MEHVPGRVTGSVPGLEPDRVPELAKRPFPERAPVSRSAS